jgi:hypothetical protein
MWGALSDERTGLSFTVAAGPRQRSHSGARVPRDSWPYFTVSGSRIPQSGGPGPQEQGGPVMPQGTGFLFVASCDSHMEVFEPASTRDSLAELLYGWLFTANLFVLALSPLDFLSELLCDWWFIASWSSRPEVFFNWTRLSLTSRLRLCQVYVSHI